MYVLLILPNNRAIICHAASTTSSEENTQLSLYLPLGHVVGPDPAASTTDPEPEVLYLQGQEAVVVGPVVLAGHHQRGLPPAQPRVPADTTAAAATAGVTETGLTPLTYAGAAACTAAATQLLDG